MDFGTHLGNKLEAVEDQVEFLSRQVELHEPFFLFLKNKFQPEFEEFLCKQLEASSDCSGVSDDEEKPNVSVASDGSFARTAESEGSNQEDEQDEDSEEKFRPPEFVEPADANEEVPSDLQPSAHRRPEDSNSASEATSAPGVTPSSSNDVRRLQKKKRVEEEGEGNLPQRQCRMTLWKRRPKASEGERNPRIKETDERTPANGNFRKLRESDEDEEDPMASGGTSVDSSSSEYSLESDEETTMKRGVRFRTPKTKLARKAGLSGPTASGSSTLRPQKLNGPTERRFKCSVCFKKFSFASNLWTHKLIHTNKKPHKCSFCEKSFRQASDLRRHKLIHTNEKPHECSHCGKCFRQVHTLRDHELIHTNEKPHECSHCNQHFRTASNRRRHELTHTSEKPHKCSFCSERFRYPSHLRRHEGRRHLQQATSSEITLLVSPPSTSQSCNY